MRKNISVNYCVYVLAIVEIIQNKVRAERSPCMLPPLYLSGLATPFTPCTVTKLATQQTADLVFLRKIRCLYGDPNPSFELPRL